MSDNIHTCSYSCHRPACIKAQRDELRDKLTEAVAERDALLGALMGLYNYDPKCPACCLSNEELELWDKAREAIEAAKREVSDE
jgi:hypothetical protein